MYSLPRRPSRAEVAAQAIEQRIADEGLAPGALLGSRKELCETLGVAPSTVSESIKLLEDRGRIYTRTGPGGGVFVAEPGFVVRLARSIMLVSELGGEVADALEVRDILESAVIVNAAEAVHSAADCRKMLSAMRALKATRDMSEYYRLNLDFHTEVAALCDNEILRTIYVGLLELVRARDPKLALLPGEDRAKLHTTRTKVHQSIADAIVNGDVTAARAASKAHMRHGHAVATHTH
jgi:DNA-binding FadR family transcriptional regulator